MFIRLLSGRMVTRTWYSIPPQDSQKCADNGLEGFSAMQVAGAQYNTTIYTYGDPSADVDRTLKTAYKNTSEQAHEESGDQASISSTGREKAASWTGLARPLSEEEQSEVAELKQRDRRVRAHEQAHLAAAGNLARGGAHFEYKTGPDGARYAVGGEVNLDTSAVEGDPQATLRKAERIRRAALAPADPSAQDRRVAADASAMALRAQRELSQQNEPATGKGSIIDRRG
jgi:hypothetical protein